MGMLRRADSCVYNQRTMDNVFWTRVEKIETGCWIWTGRTNPKGYGVHNGKRQKLANGRLQSRFAHRIAYESVNGPVPVGFETDHLCRNRRCVNPDHLEAVTREENWRRGNCVSSVNSRKTVCKRGHALDEANTYFYGPNETRHCRACTKIRNAEYHARDAAMGIKRDDYRRFPDAPRKKPGRPKKSQG